MKTTYFTLHLKDDNSLITINPEIIVVVNSYNNKGSIIHFFNSHNDSSVKVNESPNKIKELLELSYKCLAVHSAKKNNLIIIPVDSIESIVENLSGTKINMKNKQYNSLIVNETVTKIVEMINK